MPIRKTQLLISLLIGLWITGCQTSVPLEPPCPVNQFVLDTELFPADSTGGELLSPLPDSTIYSAGRTIYMGKGIANHDVMFFSSVQRASEKFNEKEEQIFGDHSKVQWEIPPELTLKSPAAEQLHFACGFDNDIYMCFMIGQYKNYLTFFNIHLYEGEADINTANLLMHEIDRHMAACPANTEE